MKGVIRKREKGSWERIGSKKGGEKRKIVRGRRGIKREFRRN